MTEDVMSTNSIKTPRTMHPERAEAPGAMLTHTAARGLAVLRIVTGLVFLWAFLDKAFGLGYATPAARAWVSGGSPTRGFLSNVEVGPLQSFFHSIAGTWWADWLFMLGLAGTGVALILGIGLRIAAGAAVAMMGMMWLAEFPLDRTTAEGTPSGSTNPVLDYHVVYGVAAVVLALTYAGHTWGLGRWWASLPFVQRHRWLI
jgi:thiosulfate dehydrogenase [quinone] large subunit